MDPSPDDPLAGFPVAVDLPVQWGDQDAFGHVNNTVFLRWFESARVEYWQRIGLFGRATIDGLGPILASSHCDYRRPVTFPDAIRAGARVARIGRTSLTIEHRVVAASSNLVAAEGVAVVVLYDYAAATPKPVSDVLRGLIHELEGKAV